jgi:hypothetical protein
MTLIDAVKPRIGVFYSTEQKDAEVQGMINGALGMFKDGGWEIDQSSPSATAIEAVILYCKMAQSTDPSQLTNHPVMISMIAQGRTQVSTVATPTAYPAGGTYAGAQSVNLSCTTKDAKIYYTTDGTTPTEESTEYTGGINISATTTLKAKAFRYAWYPSAVASETYVIS